jgi:glycosyltransferase involved in cell wall biosynthesis
MLMLGINKNIQLIRNLFEIDVLEDNRFLSSNPLYLKVYWNGFGVHRYQSEIIPFSLEEKNSLLTCCRYRDCTIPHFISIVTTLYGENFLSEAHIAGPFKEATFDIFLADYALYLANQLFGETELPQEFCDWLLASNQDTQNHAIPLPRLALALHTAIPELQSKYNLDTPTGSLGLLGWFLETKLPSLKGCIIPQCLSNWLALPGICTINSQEYGITRMHEAIYWGLTESNNFQPLDERIGALTFCAWMLLNAPDVPGFEMPSWVCLALNKNIAKDNQTNETLLMHALWHWQYGNMRFPLNGSSEHTQFTGNFTNYISRIKKSHFTKLLNIIDVPQKAISEGVNLIGWPRTEIGIGEDIRCAAFSLASVNHPFTVIDAAKRVPPNPKQVDGEISKWISAEYKYDVDLVFLDSATQQRYYAFELLNNVKVNRKVIGICPWELPIWPKKLDFVFNHVDRFWAASEFIKEAFIPYFPNRIDVAKPAVYVPESSYKPADTSGDRPFHFITIFDGLSSIHRKNPFAVINAFKYAFPINRDVRLIIKMMNLSASTAEFKQLQHCINNDPRIVLITETLPQITLWALVSSCHAFVSLHRSEGFGRNIAEAMLLERPVICSAFSGNLDFCREDNSFLVSGHKVSVAPGQYSNASGQYWFEADIEHAAASMHSVFHDYDHALQRARKARCFIKQHHSYEAVGNQYIKLLKKTSAEILPTNK